MEDVFGSRHVNVAAILNNLAGHHLAQGRFVEAEPLQRRVLAIYEQAYGPEHPQTALGLNNY